MSRTINKWLVFFWAVLLTVTYAQSPVGNTTSRSVHSFVSFHNTQSGFAADRRLGVKQTIGRIKALPQSFASGIGSTLLISYRTPEAIITNTIVYTNSLLAAHFHFKAGRAPPFC